MPPRRTHEVSSTARVLGPNISPSSALRRTSFNIILSASTSAHDSRPTSLARTANTRSLGPALPSPTKQPSRDPAPLPALTLHANPQRPSLFLFSNRANAETRAAEVGAPWVPVAYACGYLLTDGWRFQDLTGVVPAFCPVPVNSLPLLRALVTELPRLDVPVRDWPDIIRQNLENEPSLQELTKPLFEAACYCVLLRAGHPAPTGDKSDWLTTPAWALKLPRRRSFEIQISRRA